MDFKDSTWVSMAILQSWHSISIDKTEFIEEKIALDIPIPGLHHQRKFPGQAKGKLGGRGREILLAMGSRLFVLRNDNSALILFPIYLPRKDGILF